MPATLAQLVKLANAARTLRKEAFVGAALRGAGAVVGGGASLALNHPLKTMAAVSSASAVKSDYKKNMAGFKSPGVQ